jgi:hypothetical protein
MYVLFDNFNDKTISRHRSLQAAVKADVRFQKRIKKVHGANSFTPTGIFIETSDGRQSIDSTKLAYVFYLYENEIDS